VTMPAGTDPSTYTVTIVPSDIPAGYTGVFAVGKTASGQIELLQGSIQPPLPACFNTAPTVLHVIDMSHATAAEKAGIAKARAALARARR